MSPTDLERDLRTLFEAQRAAIDPPTPPYPDRIVTAVPDSRRHVAWRALAAATTGVAAVLVLVVALTGTSDRAVTTLTSSPPSSAPVPPTQPPEPVVSNPVHWETPQVRLEASDFAIEVDGVRFTADAQVGVDSDPGDATYQTLELMWQEHGVEMRWFLYFASDGTDWWVSEMRTRDGLPAAEWVYFLEERFRTPLGEAFTGDVELTAEDHGATSRIILDDLRLEAFRLP